MSKLETINQIENKILSNIKNKLWFKSYKYKNEEKNDPERALDPLMLSLPYLFISGLLFILFIDDPTTNKIALISTMIPMCLSCFGMGFLTDWFLNKFKNKKNKRKINKFIKETEIIGNKGIIDLLNGNKRFDDIKQLASFIKSHPLEKEDIDMFNKILIDNLNKEELNYLFYNEKLNDMLKDRESVDYDYIICVLNLLEKLNKNKYSETIDSKIKNKLFSPQNNNNRVKYEKDLIEKVVIN